MFEFVYRTFSSINYPSKSATKGFKEIKIKMEDVRKILKALILYIFVSVKAEDCGGDLDFSKGTISSPNYPESYPNDIKCEWVCRLILE